MLLLCIYFECCGDLLGLGFKIANFVWLLFGVRLGGFGLLTLAFVGCCYCCLGVLVGVVVRCDVWVLRWVSGLLRAVYFNLLF